MIYIKLMVIAFIVCYIIDISGAIQNMVYPIIKWILRIPEKKQIEVPVISCSTCSTFWIGILFLLISSNFTIINFGYVVLLAFLSGNITNLLYAINDTILWIIRKIFIFLK